MDTKNPNPDQTSPSPKNDVNPDLLKVLYTETCSTWRQLVDVRFKLLGLVPILSLAVMINLLSTHDPLPKRVVTFISVAGFILTLAIRLYDLRNTELYDQLISRGRELEVELGMAYGQFLGRVKASKKLLGFPVQHDTALKLIYFTCMISWLAVIVLVWIK